MHCPYVVYITVHKQYLHNLTQKRIIRFNWIEKRQSKLPNLFSTFYLWDNSICIWNLYLSQWIHYVCTDNLEKNNNHVVNVFSFPIDYWYLHLDLILIIQRVKRQKSRPNCSVIQRLQAQHNTRHQIHILNIVR